MGSRLLKYLPGLLLLLVYLPAPAQSKVLSQIPEYGNRLADFIPAQYDTLAVVYGDLDKDGKDDAALALHHVKEDAYDMDAEPTRLLLVLLKGKAGYRVAGKSATALMCRHCGGIYGDPYASIDIQKGVLSVTHYGGSNWRWSIEEKFRYQSGAFVLIGTTTDSYFSGSDCGGEGVGDAGRKFKDTNWITGEQHVIERKDDCSLVKDKRQKINKGPLVKLEAYKR